MGEASLIVVFWKWQKRGYRSQFTSEHVNTAKAMIERNTTKPIEFVCVTDEKMGLHKDIRPIQLWENPAPEYGNEARPNCTYRLKAFSSEMVEIIGPKFVWFDLDMVVTGNIDHIVFAEDDFAMWGDTALGASQYNGSLCVMQAGIHKEVWDDFEGLKSLQDAHRVGYFGSDQAWISYKVGMGKRMFNTDDGVYSFNNHYIKKGIRDMIEGTKLVFLHGSRDPWHVSVQAEYPWIKEYYR